MDECIASELLTSKINTDLNVSMDEFLGAIKQFSEHMYEATKIFLGNPFDLIEMDLSEIPSNCWFISYHDIDRGKVIKVEDEELKRMLYDFIEEHPCRAFRGRK